MAGNTACGQLLRLTLLEVLRSASFAGVINNMMMHRMWSDRVLLVCSNAAQSWLSVQHYLRLWHIGVCLFVSSVMHAVSGVL
jgi:hypothetical protein